MAPPLDHSAHSRYVLKSAIGHGGMGEVFRAQDRLTGQEVALKKIKLTLLAEPKRGKPMAADQALGEGGIDWDETQLPALAADLTQAALPSVLADAATLGARMSPGASTHELRRFLTQEFRTLASMRHPNIVSVIDHGFDENRQPFFTMELLEDAAPLTTACRPLPLPVRGELLLQVLDALTYLHRRGILHRDLKPSNILVVKGKRGLLAKLLDFGLAVFKRANGDAQVEVAGTLGYIAPEVLTGGEVTQAADLYSLGVMAFEILSGRPLVTAQRPTELVTATLNMAPDLALSELPAPLAGVLSKLLAREPEARYASAQLAAQALAKALALPAPVETADVRESLLGAATLVGREPELAALRDSLSLARRSQGSMILIGGESGVGKSRLLDEARILALVAGMRVLRGQAVSELGSGYGLFIDALRALSLSEPLDAQAAGVLSALLPDLPMLLSRSIEPAPPLDVQAARLRLIQTVEAVLLGVSQPTLLILEDVHWISADGLELLQRLSTRLQQRTLLILCSYRAEERPELPKLLPSSASLIVKRLSRSALFQLAAAMLGDGIVTPDLIDLLHRETEGNALFAVEVVRNLAEEAGGMAAVGRGGLPTQVFAGGIAGALDRRLARVPGSAQSLLRFAAVIGRQIDLPVLGALVPELTAELLACAEVAVLEVSEDRWRFAHDKLRERLLARLSPLDSQALHSQVALAIEKLYPGGLGGHAGRLAFHHEQSGNLRLAGHYAAVAGEQALQRGALGEATDLLERALKLKKQVGASQLEETKVRRLLVSAQFGLGRYESCTDSFMQALAVLGRPFPRSQVQLAGEILGQISLQLLHRIHPSLIRRPAQPDEVTELYETTQLFRVGFEALIWMSKQTEGVHSILHFLNLAERGGDAAMTSSACMALAYGLSMTPLSRVSYYYLELAARLQEGIDPHSAEELFRLRGEAAIGIMLIDQARSESAVSRGMALAVNLGDLYAQMFLTVIQVYLERMDGKFAQALKTAEALLALARRTDNDFFLGLGLVLAGGIELRCGRVDEATRLLSAALHPDQVGTTRSAAAGLLALCRLRGGEAAEARRLAEQALREFATSLVTTAVGWEGLPAAVEVILTLWQRSEQGGQRAELEVQLRRGLRVLHKYMGAVRICRPGALMLEAQFLWATGQLAAARARLQAALANAEAMRLPYERALAELWLAHLTAEPEPARQQQRLLALRSLGVDTAWLPVVGGSQQTG